MASGTELVGGRIPGELIVREMATTDSSTFTSETVLITAVAPVVIGRLYSIHGYVHIASTVDNDDGTVLLREDSVSGTVLQVDTRELSVDDQESFGQTFNIHGWYTADATENKTIVLTARREAGTGDFRLESLSTRPSFLVVRYESG